MLKITPLNWIASLNILKNASVLRNKGNKSCDLRVEDVIGFQARTDDLLKKLEGLGGVDVEKKVKTKQVWV